VFAAARDHHDPNRLVGGCVGEGGDETGDDHVIEGIALVGPVEREAQDSAVEFADQSSDLAAPVLHGQYCSYRSTK
jgi:hypothetical protein